MLKGYMFIGTFGSIVYYNECISVIYSIFVFFYFLSVIYLEALPLMELSLIISQSSVMKSQVIPNTIIHYNIYIKKMWILCVFTVQQLSNYVQVWGDIHSTITTKCGDLLIQCSHILSYLLSTGGQQPYIGASSIVERIYWSCWLRRAPIWRPNSSTVTLRTWLLCVTRLWWTGSAARSPSPNSFNTAVA